MHITTVVARLSTLALCAALTGCAARNQLNNVGHAANQPAPGTAANAEAAAPVAAPPPYVLSAKSNGPMVQFTLQNQSDQELRIQNKDFALVVPGEERKVIPYSTTDVSIDLPTNVIGPRESIQGRAVFNENNMPNGCRLVFKPHSRPSDAGTYAAISGHAAI